MLPDEIRRRRILAGLSRHELADKAGVSYNRIAHIEGRQTSLVTYPRTAKKLARALKCKVEDIAQIQEDDNA